MMIFTDNTKFERPGEKPLAVGDVVHLKSGSPPGVIIEVAPGMAKVQPEGEDWDLWTATVSLQREPTPVRAEEPLAVPAVDYSAITREVSA